MHRGTIVSLQLDRGFGFIFEKQGEPDIFFHAKDVVGVEFNERLKERRVQFDVVTTDKGPRAANVQPAE